MKKLLVPFTTLFVVLCMNVSYAYTDYTSRYSDRDDRYSARSSHHIDVPDPVSELKQAVNDLEKFIKGKDAAHPGMLKAYLEKKIFPHFDFDAMSGWITGPYARYMSTEDKIKFQSKLQETFLTSLVKHMGSFDPSTTKLKYDRTRFRNNGDEAVVRLRVVRKGQPPARLEFGMQRNKGKWRIVDVKANGTSAVMYYRHHFIAELRGYDDRRSAYMR